MIALVERMNTHSLGVAHVPVMQTSSSATTGDVFWRRSSVMDKMTAGMGLMSQSGVSLHHATERPSFPACILVSASPLTNVATASRNA